MKTLAPICRLVVLAGSTVVSSDNINNLIISEKNDPKSLSAAPISNQAIVYLANEPKRYTPAHWDNNILDGRVLVAATPLLGLIITLLEARFFAQGLCVQGENGVLIFYFPRTSNFRQDNRSCTPINCCFITLWHVRQHVSLTRGLLSMLVSTFFKSRSFHSSMSFWLLVLHRKIFQRRSLL